VECAPGTVDSNGDGPVKAGQEWSAPGDGEDGAGHPWGVYVDRILDTNAYRTVSLTDGHFSSCGGSCREYTVAAVNLKGPARIKVALAWNACTTSTFQDASLANDLDLVVQRPSGGSCGGTLHQSIATVSEVEMVYDDCLVGSGSGGTYTIKVRIKGGGALAGCGSSTSERIAVAWSLQ
jgi:hypothetical protein